MLVQMELLATNWTITLCVPSHTSLACRRLIRRSVAQRTCKPFCEESGRVDKARTARQGCVLDANSDKAGPHQCCGLCRDACLLG